MHKSKGKFSGVLHKGFKPDKCKTSLRMAVGRIKLLRNRKEVQVRQMRREVAQLLEANQDMTARIRVEHVIREEKFMQAYDLIEVYCELIVARLSIIDSQK
ncbi:Regulator of Vps4 activity in the MVB pathway protein [Zea mays]|uniref:Regulator of Vps4 activity in the MVB pathway protein n=1 Tax=Zea mays TaxID=4577 RepID=A0A1D6JSD6_MAIZE|nr:Regulator of Vps4 activity in the MVB pathway protein [Zea mays]